MKDSEHLTPEWLHDPTLFAAETVPETGFPESFRPWLELEQSMTTAVGAHVGAPIRVVVAFAARAALLPWETALMNHPQTGAVTGFVRQIALRAAEGPVLLARSVTVAGTELEGVLSGLDARPLAVLLFESRDWMRRPGILPLRTDDGLYGRAASWRHAPTKETLIVEEYFLPMLSFEEHSGSAESSVLGGASGPD